MITFTNAPELFQKFNEQYGNNVLFQNNPRYGVVIPGNLMSASFEQNDPFSCNIHVSPQYIFYNEAKADELGLTEEERFACIAHEIGHYRDNTPLNGSSQEREYNADDFATQLGLRLPLISALEKMADADAQLQGIIARRTARL